MYAVQKRDFMGQWVDMFHAQMFEDADKFRKDVASLARVQTRIIQQ